MSHVTTHRTQSIIVLVALSILGGSFAEPATAVPPLRIPRIRPPVKIPRLPRPPVAIPEDFDTALKWGTDEPAVIRSLDEAETAVATEVDDTASRVAVKPESKARIQECAGEGLKGAGESYKQRFQEATDAGNLIPEPNFHEVGAGMASCMEAWRSTSTSRSASCSTWARS